MYNVLSDEQKKELKQEYLLRFFTVALFLISGVFVCGIITLIPDITLTLLKKSSLNQELAEFKEGNEGKLRGVYADSIKEIDQQVRTIALIGQAGNPHEIIEKIIENRGNGITLNRFSYAVVGTSTPIELEGSASRLDNLLKFQATMQKMTPFSSAEFPIELLSKPKNSAVSFNLQLK